MSAETYREWVRTRQRVEARTGQGEVYATGVVFAYSEAPTVSIETEDGRNVAWRADMTQAVTPVDDPSNDPIGTVRREHHTHDDGYTTWQLWTNQYGDRTWRVSWSTHPVARGFLRKDVDMVGCPVIGPAPGTPAAEAVDGHPCTLAVDCDADGHFFTCLSLDTPSDEQRAVLS